MLDDFRADLERRRPGLVAGAAGAAAAPAAGAAGAEPGALVPTEPATLEGMQLVRRWVQFSHPLLIAAPAFSRVLPIWLAAVRLTPGTADAPAQLLLSCQLLPLFVCPCRAFPPMLASRPEPPPQALPLPLRL